MTPQFDFDSAAATISWSKLTSLYRIDPWEACWRNNCYPKACGTASTVSVTLFCWWKYTTSLVIHVYLIAWVSFDLVMNCNPKITVLQFLLCSKIYTICIWVNCVHSPVTTSMYKIHANYRYIFVRKCLQVYLCLINIIMM